MYEDCQCKQIQIAAMFILNKICKKTKRGSLLSRILVLLMIGAFENTFERNHSGNLSEAFWPVSLLFCANFSPDD